MDEPTRFTEADFRGLPAKLKVEVMRQMERDPYYFTKFEDYPYDEWKPVRQRFDFVNKHAKGDILDLGCGVYPVSAEVPHENGRKVGLDVSIQTARKAWKEFDEFYFFDITQTDKNLLKDEMGTFDTVVASELLEHIPHDGRLENTVEAVHYLLNKGGQFLVTVPSGNSIAGYVDKMQNYLKTGNFEFDRFKFFHRTHVSCLKIGEWEKLFGEKGFDVANFDYRPSEIVEGFPKEKTPGWKTITKLAPDYLGHQYFFVLERLDV